MCYGDEWKENEIEIDRNGMEYILPNFIKGNKTLTKHDNLFPLLNENRSHKIIDCTQQLYIYNYINHSVLYLFTCIRRELRP